MNRKAWLCKAEEVSFMQDFSGPWLCSWGYEPPAGGYRLQHLPNLLYGWKGKKSG